MIVSITIVLYILALFLIAFSNLAKIKDHRAFFVAGKSGSTAMVTGSLLSTILGGSAIIGAIDIGGTMGWATSWFMICAAIGLFVIIPFAANISKLESFSLPDMLGSMHGDIARSIASIVIPIAWLGIIATQVIASAKILESFTNLSYQTGVIVSGTIFTAYTMIGGQFSILKTDAVQAFLIIVGLGVVATFAFLFGKNNGISIEYNFALFNQNFSPLNLLVLLLTYSTTFTTGPDIYTRLFCAKNQQVIKKSLVISGLILLPIAFTIGFLSVTGAAFVGNLQGSVIINLSKAVLPEAVVALLVVALLSTVLSSADTTLLSASVIVTEIAQKNKIGDGSIKITRIAMFFIGLLSILIAWHFSSIINILMVALSVYAGAFTLPIILGLCKFSFTPKYLSAAIITGGSIAFIGKILTFITVGNIGNFTMILSFVFSGILLFLGRSKQQQ